METLTEAIARALRMELARRDITASTFAAKIGTQKSNVSRWTKAAVEMKTSHIELVAAGLDMTPSELIALAESVREVDADADADPIPQGAFTKGDLGLAADTTHD